MGRHGDLPRATTLAALLLFVAGCGLAGPSLSPTDSSAMPPAQALSMLRPGDEVTLDPIDADGAWGTITVRRGDDTGGYPTNAVDPDSFVVEVWIEYEVTRNTEVTFGAEDWALATVDDLMPVGGLFEPEPPKEPWEVWDLVPLPRGATVGGIATEPLAISGWLLFRVPRTNADDELALVYRPAGFAQAVTVITVRQPSDAPAPVPTATPEPTPAALVYEDQPGAAFSVIRDADADALFAAADTCSNPVAGYSVAYPDDWYTNTAVGETPACSWFSPTRFVVEGPGVPQDVAIVIRSFEGGIGFVHVPDYTIREQVMVDGWAAARAEEIGGLGGEGFLPRSVFTYTYTVFADSDPLGLKVVATTSNQSGGDYELNKAVLDRVMASLRFDQ